MADLTEIFLDEAQELLEQMEPLILELEKAATVGTLEELFRVAHTLKGSAGVAGISGVRALAHQLEELLDCLRAGELKMNSDLADALLEGFDVLRSLLEKLAQGRDEQPPPALLEKIARFAAVDPAQTREETARGGEEPPGARVPLLEDADMLLLQKALANGRNVFYLELDFAADFFHRGHNLDYLLEDLSALGEIVGLRLDGRKVPPLSAIEAEEYYLFFSLFVITGEDLQAITDVFIFVLDEKNKLNLWPVSPADLGALGPCRKAAPPYSVEHAREVLRQQEKALAAASAEVLPGLTASVWKIIRRVADSFGLSCPFLEGIQSDPQAEKELLSRAIDDLKEQLKEAAGIAAGDKKEAEKSVTPDREAVTFSREKARPQSFLKVSRDTADALLNLAGELIIAKNALPYFIKNLEAAGREDLARDLKEKYGYLDRIAREFQERVMDIWLLPIAQIFDRFPRFVRDYSKKANKKIHLVCEGKETRLDRNILENIYEPLLHIVRNALDHGLEEIEERQRKGKKPEGILLLRAYRLGERVVVQVADDGRGVDGDALAQKAIAAGLVSSARAAEMSYAEKVNLLFAPGLSTREAVSELSGRGVGMDVVKETTERLGGTVQVESEPDRGTTVTLALPFTLATNEVLLVNVGGGLYGIPLAAVRETVRYARRDLKTVRGRALAVLRNEILPVSFVHRCLGAHESEAEEITLVVLWQKVALSVDRVLGKEEIIIRPLTGELKKVPLFLGAAVLGDGRVLLVLEPNVLAKEAC